MNEPHDQGFDPSTSPAEIQSLLVNFMGQTYAEINKLDKNIIGTSTNLIQKGGEFKNLAQTVINNVPNNFKFNARPQPPQPQPPPPAVQQAYVAHVSEPYLVGPSKPLDDNQLLFDFDNSATAVKINDALSRIESCLTKIENKLSKNDKSIAEITAAIANLSSSIDNISKEKKQRKTDSIY